MKKTFKFPLLGAVSALLLLTAVSCSDDKDNNPEGSVDAQKTATIRKYVDDVVVATYKLLADETINLYNDCLAMQANLTQANLDEACREWVDARKYWELSEAFLYGPAAIHYIDPHIDSWPLDKAQLDLALKNTTLIANMKEHGCNFGGFITLGYGLQGFHAVEYMLFRDGGPRKLAGGVDKDGIPYGSLTEAELIYCVAIAEDLRNQCILLEACWAGVEGISAAKQAILEEAELAPSMNYGEIMETAGEPGNTIYKTQIAAYAEILQGAADIADEVGNAKITDPVSSGNVLDVESWYSWNSIDDFADNIRSIRNAYYGSMDGTIATSSLSAHIKSLDATLDGEIKAAIADATGKIEAMPTPFRDNLTKAATDASVDACNVLQEKLLEAIELIY